METPGGKQKEMLEITNTVEMRTAFDRSSVDWTLPRKDSVSLKTC